MIKWLEKIIAKCTERQLYKTICPWPFLRDNPNTFQLLKTTALTMKLIKWSDQFEVKLSEIAKARALHLWLIKAPESTKKEMRNELETLAATHCVWAAERHSRKVCMWIFMQNIVCIIYREPFNNLTTWSKGFATGTRVNRHQVTARSNFKRCWTKDWLEKGQFNPITARQMSDTKRLHGNCWALMGSGACFASNLCQTITVSAERKAVAFDGLRHKLAGYTLNLPSGVRRQTNRLSKDYVLVCCRRLQIS